MSRMPVSASVALAALLPACAAALGLGEIESRSYLNQPLSAEIPVTSESPGEIDGLSVSLASADTFTQYGLPRPALLGDLRFAVAEAARGGIIRVTSTKPISEPFLTLLLEVRWSQGRLLREFTVLLDPPDFAGAVTPRPAQQQPAAASPATVTPAPAAPRRAPVVEPSSAPAPQPASAPARGSEATHTVARNETLWGLASRYRPPTADMNQIMVAIYRTNPEAFAGNINRLRAGALLRIPDGTAVEAIAVRDAAAEVQRQNSEWRGAAAPREAPARLELVPPPEQAPPDQAGAAAAKVANETMQSQLEESRRLLAVKDAELKALRDQVAALQERVGEVAVEEELAPPPPPAVTPTVEEAPAEKAPAAIAAPKAPAPAARPKPPADEGTGILGQIGSLLMSPWFWIPAAMVLLGALLLARRRSGAEENVAWAPPTRSPAKDEAESLSAESSMIVHEEPARASGRFERRALGRGGDEELPLERTISTEGPINLDQADPLAEADFHMAYGLYDQAADLLTAAVGREPARRDLRLKLLDVYFVWENREGFLKEARALRERIGSDTDPDWKRVVIMGKQLCPAEAMFAGAAAPASAEMDLDLSGDGGADIDFALGGDSGVIDFDIGTGFGDAADSEAPTSVAKPDWVSGSNAQTQEIPTIELPSVEGGLTREAPTIENPLLTPTVETPTIETRSGEGTVETPTMETPRTAGESGATARMRTVSGSDERADQTAEIDLEDLGLDLAGLDDAARDMATGLQEALPEEAANLDFDLSGGGQPDGGESTAEMEKGADLAHLTHAISKSDTSARKGPATSDDTIDQPRAGGAASETVLSDTSHELEALNIDLDFSAAADEQSDLTATSLRAIRPRAPDDATMTEVGTKLDLARAYLDMGDPDGARSILNEVVEEGDPAQREEARHLLDGMDN